MPLNGFPALSDGSLDMDDAGAIVEWFSGLPLTATGKVAVAADAAIALTRNGFGFDATGRLVITAAANPVATIHNGFGFDSAGRLCVTTGAAPVRHGAFYDGTRRVLATVA